MLKIERVDVHNVTMGEASPSLSQNIHRCSSWDACGFSAMLRSSCIIFAISANFLWKFSTMERGFEQENLYTISKHATEFKTKVKSKIQVDFQWNLYWLLRDVFNLSMILLILLCLSYLFIKSIRYFYVCALFIHTFL